MTGESTRRGGGAAGTALLSIVTYTNTSQNLVVQSGLRILFTAAGVVLHVEKSGRELVIGLLTINFLLEKSTQILYGFSFGSVKLQFNMYITCPTFRSSSLQNLNCRVTLRTIGLIWGNACSEDLN